MPFHDKKRDAGGQAARAAAQVFIVIALALFGGTQARGAPRVLLIGQGPDGHPPQTHEFMAGVRIMEHLLNKVPDLDVATAKAEEPWPEGPELIDKADGVVLFLTQGGRFLKWNAERNQAFHRLRERKGGFVALHWAVGAKDAEYIEPCLVFLGGCHGGPDRKYVKTETTLGPASPVHPIAEGFTPMTIHEEFYYQLKFTPRPGVDPVLVADIDGNSETAAWAWQRPDGGRSFGFVGLHFHTNWREQNYRRIVLRAILWTLQHELPSQLDLDCPEEVYRLARDS